MVFTLKENVYCTIKKINLKNFVISADSKTDKIIEQLLMTLQGFHISTKSTKKKNAIDLFRKNAKINMSLPVHQSPNLCKYFISIHAHNKNCDVRDALYTNSSRLSLK